MSRGVYVPHDSRGHTGAYYYITCPACGTEVKGFNRSLAGRGKLCPGCG